MRLFSLFVSLLAMACVTEAWIIRFWAFKDNGKEKRVFADGTKRGSCINLRSDYNWNTNLIRFAAHTPIYPDPKGYTAYEKANCKGRAYYGVEGDQYMNRRFRSYRVK